MDNSNNEELENQLLEFLNQRNFAACTQTARRYE
jgi:hypothetical protein